MHLVVLLGIVSLPGDIAYSGARSVVGPYLATLGATASIVGLVAGVAELSGFALALPLAISSIALRHIGFCPSSAMDCSFLFLCW